MTDKLKGKVWMSEKEALLVGSKAVASQMVVSQPNPGYEYEWFRIVCKSFQGIINEMAKDLYIDREGLFDLCGVEKREDFYKALPKDIRKYWRKP